MARGDELTRGRLDAANRAAGDARTPQDIQIHIANYVERYYGPLFREFQLLKEKLGLLTGERGDGSNRALTPSNPGDTPSGGGTTVVVTDPPVDASVPTQPQSFTASGSFTHIILAWTPAAYTGHLYTEIWRNVTDDFGTATKINTTAASLYSDTVDLNSKFYYWSRFVNALYQPGQESLSAYAETAPNISAEMQRISDYLNSGQLAAQLQSRIDLIDSPVTGLLDRLTAEADARQAGDGQLQSQIESVVLSSIADVYYQPDMPTGVIAENSRWFDDDDGNHPYLYKDGAWVDIADQRILDAIAASATERSARIAADLVQADQISAVQAQLVDPSTGLGALGGGISSLNTTVTQQGTKITANTTSLNQIQAIVGSNYASLQQMFTVTSGPDGVTATALLKADVNGYLSGWGLWNNGTTSQMIFNIDDFAVGKVGAGTVYPFIVSGGITYIKSAMIAQASITSGQIQNLTVDKIVGDTASFVINNIGFSTIDFAKIQNNIQSGNYIAGAAGWRIDKSGWAEFRNIIARGDIEASSLKANVAIVGTANIVNANVTALKIAGNSATVIVGSQATAAPAAVTVVVAVDDIPAGQSTVPIIVTGSADTSQDYFFDVSVNPANLGGSGNLIAALPPAGVSAFSVDFLASPGTYNFYIYNHGAPSGIFGPGWGADPGCRKRSIMATLGKR